MSTIKLCMLALVLVLVASFAWAAQTQTSLKLAGLPPVVITTSAQAATVLATDAGTNASKRVHVVKLTNVNGVENVLLIRVQRATNGLFVDVVLEATIGEVSTRSTATTLTGSSHPSPTKDAIDTAALVAAGGS